MKIVLLQDVKDLGKKGELVNVSDGYGKNYLIPRKLATVADAGALNELRTREEAKKHRIEIEKKTAAENAAKLDGKSVKISARSGQNGKLFGSVTSKEVAVKLHDELGIDVDKKNIVCDDIRSFGTFTAVVKLYQGITATIYIIVGE